MILGKSEPGDVILWGLILIFSVVVLGLVVWYVRRWSLSSPDVGDDDTWSLQHLRDLRKQGKITDEEFEGLKAKMLSAYRDKSTRRDRASPEGLDS